MPTISTEHTALAIAWLNYNGQRGTERQVAKLMQQFGGEQGFAILARMCAERGLI